MTEPPPTIPPIVPGAERAPVTPFDEKAPPALPMRGPIVALRIVGENVQLGLPTAQDRLTLGAAPSPSVDLTLDSESVSRLHAVLVRRGPKLRVVDQKSTNGTYYRGHRDPDFEIAPGDVFEVSRRIKLLALDQHLLILRHRLLWVLGLRAHAAADAAIQSIASNAPLLLVGPAGCEQRLIAAEIHRRSPHADRDFVAAPVGFGTRAEQDAILDHGARGTIYVDLTGGATKLPHHFAAHMFEHSRPIIAARNELEAVELLDNFATRCEAIHLATPAERADDIPRLLDALILQEHAARGVGGELMSITAIGEANIDALKAHAWPGHFDDLRHQVKRFHALLTNGVKLRPAARALGLKSVSSLIEAFSWLGVRIKAGEGDDVSIEGAVAELPIPPGSPTR